ncbi:hypothetical protein HKX48_006314 [Thoreauomyces humboldtii]|nr:hypothetical protein HKX48_006314 [Thoreauomyces humboldtii]
MLPNSCWTCGLPLDSLPSTKPREKQLFSSEGFTLVKFDLEHTDPDCTWFHPTVVISANRMSPPGTATLGFMGVISHTFCSNLRTVFDLDLLLGYPTNEEDVRNALRTRAKFTLKSANALARKVTRSTWRGNDGKDSSDETYLRHFAIPARKGDDPTCYGLREGYDPNEDVGRVGGLYWPSHFGCMMLASAWTGKLDHPESLFDYRDLTVLCPHPWSASDDLSTSSKHMRQVPGFPEIGLPSVLDYGSLPRDMYREPPADLTTNGRSMSVVDRFDALYYWDTPHILRRPDIFPALSPVVHDQVFASLGNPHLGSLADLGTDILLRVLHLLVPTAEGCARLAETCSGWRNFLRGADPRAPGVQSLARARCAHLGIMPTEVDTRGTAAAIKERMALPTSESDWAAYLRACGTSLSMRNRARIRGVVRSIERVIPELLKEAGTE